MDNKVTSRGSTALHVDSTSQQLNTDYVTSLILLFNKQQKANYNLVDIYSERYNHVAPLRRSGLRSNVLNSILFFIRYFMY